MKKERKKEENFFSDVIEERALKGAPGALGFGSDFNMDKTNSGWCKFGPQGFLLKIVFKKKAK